MATATPAADVSAITAKFKVLRRTDFREETTLLVEREAIAEVCALAKAQLGYDLLLDVSGVDYFGEEPRFEVVYELYSLARGAWVRLKVRVSEDDLTVPTVSHLWATANWHEREAFDMYGIRFAGHEDLRRILMWEGYPFFPLRKDFPLGGRTSDAPEVAFSRPAPLEGGPFVTVPTTATTKDREPRARVQE